MNCFSAADILLPDFSVTDGTKWAVIACDQFTSEPAYWREVEKTVGDAPSTLRLALPEIYLSETEARLPAITDAMKEAEETVLRHHENTMIYLERRQSDGAIRQGIVGKIDLEAYDYRKGSRSPIRATEGTILERIPPRVKIRRNATLELPHVMLLIDDRENTVIEPLAARKEELPLAYRFPLMQGGGDVVGRFLPDDQITRIIDALDELASPAGMQARYGASCDSPFLFAVGDGNHSLATAKALYEEIKAEIGEKALSHPARYALVEVVNLHSPALRFEPIYRAVFGADKDDLLSALRTTLSSLCGNAAKQTFEVLTGDSRETLSAKNPEAQLPVGTLQAFLDRYLAAHPSVRIDYIHGEDSLEKIVREQNAVGFLFRGMEKEELFRTVLCDGALPRKTFSMGHARDKRYYIEARKIK